MVDIIDKVRNYIKIRQDKSSSEKVISCEYENTKESLKDFSTLLDSFEELHAAYNLITTANSLVKKTESDLLNKLEDFEE